MSDALEERFTLLVHGASGSGKTRLASSAPKPMLFLDVEAASRFVKGRKIHWDPTTENPPEDDGTWDICIVTVDTYKKADKAYEWVKGRKHPFKSLVVDSISELQAKAVEEIKGRQQLQTQDWGRLLHKLSFFIRDLRDLIGDPKNSIQVVVLTAMSKNYDGILKPYLQGQIADQIPYWLDVTGYLYVTQNTNEETGEIVETRNLLVGRHQQFEAKSNAPGLPNIIQTPNIIKMQEAIGVAMAEVD